MSDRLISLCMIVKNEEDSLERCLQSVYRYLDEIILVDTGSTDSTVDIAKKYTDNIYHFEWINDFSAARNVSLQYATGKWILCLDADDYMEEKDIAHLRNVLSRLEPEEGIVYHQPYISMLGEDERGNLNVSKVVRVFPNYMGLLFHRPIHEQVYSTRGVALKSADLKIPIYHTGYQKSEIEKKDKHGRNLSIFKEMEKNTKYNAYDYFTLGNQYSVMENYAEALTIYQKGIAIAPPDGSWVADLYLSALTVMIRLGKLFDAWEFVEKYMLPYTKYSDVQTIIALLEHRLGFWKLSKQGFLDAIELAEQRTRNNLDPYLMSPEHSMNIPLENLAKIYEKEANLPQSIYYITKQLIANPQNIAALFKLVELMSLNESADSIVAFLHKLLNIEDHIREIKLAKIAVSIGNRELASHFVEQGDTLNRLEPHEVLRYHLLHHNKERFTRFVSRYDWQRSEHHPQLLKHLALGTIVWGIDIWSEVPEKLYEYPHLDIARKLRDGTDISQESEINNVLFEILTDLYLLKQDNVYGDLIDRIATLDLINNLTSYFFQTHQISTALQYASHLLDNDALNAKNSINLAFLYLGQGNIEEAINWLNYTMSLEPKSKDVILLMCSICNDPITKEELKKRLLAIEPRYASLSMFRSL
ncbi:glycosyltransferase [Cohnella sp. AR92]|uniref:glycosyltransferase n=1 Tax=Cohnella sp. AR92 TaxID=648716 RepID=UPI0013152604|nr:glycosyltransferase [Cohnella sp. AR92]